MMGLLANEPETGTLIHVARGLKHGICPQANFLVARSPGEAEALLHELSSDSTAASFWFDQQEAELAHGVGFLNEQN